MRDVMAIARQGFQSARLPGWEVVVGSLCISFGVVGLRVVNDSHLWNRAMETGRQNSVARVVPKEGAVRFRPSESIVWHDVAQAGQSLAARDTVFTNPQGIASLT